MAALECIAAAVLASSSPRSIRSHSGSTLERRAHRHRMVSRVLARQRVAICRCWEKSARLQGPARTRTPSLAIFSTLGDPARWLGTGNGAADRGGGGVRCGLRANGDGPPRVVRLSMADSLCDRMERGEEEAPDRRRVAFPRSHFCKPEGGPLPTSDRRKFPSGNFRSARDLEGAKRVSRGQAYRKTSMSPFARRPHGTPPPPLPCRSVPVC